MRVVLDASTTSTANAARTDQRGGSARRTKPEFRHLGEDLGRRREAIFLTAASTMASNSSRTVAMAAGHALVTQINYFMLA
ncbi:MAG: hypothetical protein WBQ75_03475 [Acetobacteraceae bacterium]